MITMPWGIDSNMLKVVEIDRSGPAITTLRIKALFRVRKNRRSTTRSMFCYTTTKTMITCGTHNNGQLGTCGAHIISRLGMLTIKDWNVAR